MAMAGMAMPDETWRAAAGFLGVWVVMMAAMMLPSLAPVLWRHRQDAASAGEPQPGLTTGLVGIGYVVVWAVVGTAVYALGTALAAIEVRIPGVARDVPIAVGVVVLIGGALQFTAWKAHHLRCCRAVPGHGARPLGAATALTTGVRLGVHCVQSCAGLMAILLAVGVMDLRAMAVVTAAITLERLAPAGERVARAIGGVTVAAAVFLIARATMTLVAA